MGMLYRNNRGHNVSLGLLRSVRQNHDGTKTLHFREERGGSFVTHHVTLTAVEFAELGRMCPGDEWTYEGSAQRRVEEAGMGEAS